MRWLATGLGALLLLFAVPASARDFQFGADLSFADEMDDCGAIFQDAGGRQDVFALFKAHGTNLVRLRLWVDPDWTTYSALADVKRSIARAKARGMRVMLDFHYSGDWADPKKQIVPAAWAGLADDALAEKVYRYTYDTLVDLNQSGLMPDFVQVGNETNSEVMVKEPWREGKAIDWPRNAKLLNAGIKGVRDAGAHSTIKPKVVLHIAQPENAEGWFAAAATAGVTDFDVIGLSYYPQWSKSSLTGLRAAVNRLSHRYPKADVMVVETGYPWTLQWNDSNNNVLDAQSLIKPYPATPEGQGDYMVAMTQAVIAGGGAGVIYWAPDWVSTSCRTRWGQGSNWENAAFFDFSGRALPALDYPRASYSWPVTVTFRFSGTQPAAGGHFVLWGDFLGARDIAVGLPDASGAFEYSVRLMPGQKYRLQVFADASLQARLLNGGKVENGFYTDIAPTQDATVALTLADPTR